MKQSKSCHEMQQKFSFLSCFIKLSVNARIQFTAYLMADSKNAICHMVPLSFYAKFHKIAR